MPVAPAITKLDDLLERPAVAVLLAWRRQAVQSAKLDRNELTIYVDRSAIREACAILKTSAEAQFNFLSDLTCVDLYPSEPR
ncbi:MAG TPA: NADH-quinone oxidoreductase subunit C, partial [Terriglobales bacterium]